MYPSIICFLWLWTLGLHCTNELRLELNLRDISGSKATARIACEPVEKAPLKNGGTEQRILWQGSKFGITERDILRSRMPGEVLVPDIRVNASERYRCALLSSNSDIDKNSLRKRIHRALSASVPAEYGTCRPGYRLDQDRCYPCPAGSYTSGQDTKCYLCPKDFYSSREAADSCASCPAGMKTSAKGADSEDKCLEVDSKGHPVSKNSTKWVIVGICVLVFLVAVWIVIAIALLWWYKDEGYGGFAQRILKMEKGGAKPHTYDTVAKDSAEDHIYAEIGEVEDQYEEPIKRKKDHNYMEFIPNEDDHIYEEIKIPDDKRRKSSEHIYETPITKKEQKQKEAAKKGTPRKAARSRSFDSPRTMRNKQKKSDEHIYEEIYNVSVPEKPKESLPRYMSHGFQPVFTASDEAGPSDSDLLQE